MDKQQKYKFNILTVLVYIVSPFLSIPLILFSVYKRLKSFPIFYALIVSFVSYLYIPPIEWDKARHIDFYYSSQLLSLKEFFIINFQDQPDFLFRFLLYIGSISGIRVHYIFFVVTFITVFLIFSVFYNELIKLKNFEKYTLIITPLIIFSLSYTDIISGLRYTLAVSFIFYGYYIGLIEKKKIAVMWLLLGLITHFSVILFVLLYFFYPLLNKIKIVWLRIFLIVSLSFIFIPNEMMLSFFKGIGVGSLIDTKLDSYLGNTSTVNEITNSMKIINFFNVAWVIVLNVFLIFKNQFKNIQYAKLIIVLLIATNVFVSFPIVYNRYNLFLKLILVLFLFKEELSFNRKKIVILFVFLFFVVYFNQVIVMRNVLINMLGFNVSNWSFIYQIFENNFGLKDIK